MKVAVTGAGGFIGRALVARLRSAGEEVLPIVRAPAGIAGERALGGIDAATDWGPPLAGADAVVHLAARVHLMRESARDPLAAFRRVNKEATLNLARQAAEAGVRRFLLMSTIKVNGEETRPGHPFRRDDEPNPSDPYAISKYEAEQGLGQIGRATGMEIVVIRPPLVHGPGAGGNLAAMMRWLERGVPLPLGAVTGNRRSLVGIDNLVDLTALCLTHPAAAGAPWLVSDGTDLSTRQLIELLAAAMGRKPRLLPFPPALLAAAARLLGKRAAAARLLGSLQIDIDETRRELGWHPAVSLEEGLRRMAAGRAG